MIAIYFLSLAFVENLEKKRLLTISKQSITHTQNIFYKIILSFNAIQNTSSFKACSKEHIRQMQGITLADNFIIEVDYFQNGIFVCNSWANFTSSHQLTLANHITNLGNIKVSALANPDLKAQPLLLFQQGNYIFFVDPKRLVDFVSDLNVQITLLSLTTSIG